MFSKISVLVASSAAVFTDAVALPPISLYGHKKHKKAGTNDVFKDILNAKKAKDAADVPAAFKGGMKRIMHFL
jgi:hypothetical protein